MSTFQSSQIYGPLENMTWIHECDVYSNRQTNQVGFSLHKIIQHSTWFHGAKPPKRKQTYSNYPFSGATVDGQNPAPVDRYSLSHYLQGFIHTRWCRISSINSMLVSGRLYMAFQHRSQPSMMDMNDAACAWRCIGLLHGDAWAWWPSVV